MKNIKIGRLSLYPSIQKYSSNGASALSFFEKSGELYITLSTNLEDDFQEGNKIFIKEDKSTYSDMTNILLQNGYLIDCNRTMNSGFNQYRLYEMSQLLIELASHNKDLE